MDAGELQQLTISGLRTLASDRGYSVTKTKKADIIAEILEQEAGTA